MGALDHVRLRLVETLDDASEFWRWLGERREILGVDTETGGLTWWNNRLRLVQFGDRDTGWAVPWEGWGGVAKQALDTYEGDLVLHNTAFDLRFLEEAGVDVRPLRHRVQDTSIMAHLLDSTRPRGLKPLGESIIDRNAERGAELLHEGMTKNRWTWATVPVNFPPYWFYSALDPVLTARLYSEFKQPISSGFAELYEMEMALLHVLSGMERRGMLIDQDYTVATRDRLANFEEEMLAYIGTRWPRFRRLVRGETRVSIGNDALAQQLLDDGAPLSKTTPTGKFSVDDEVLSGLSDSYELASCVTQLRQASKFRKMYFDAILDNLHEGRVRPSINQLGARTGRMSVSRPPFQQLPSDSPLVRDCVVFAEDNVGLTIDYDQIELRVLAHVAREQTMIDAIHAGEDLHWANARMLYGPDATQGHRKMTKGAAFLKVYGGGASKLASQQGIQKAQAQAFMQQFDATFTGVAGTIRDMEQVVRERQRGEGRGYVYTHFGRRQYIDKGKEYTGLNYYCQGTAADILKYRIVELDKAGLAQYALLPVHDEIIFEVPGADSEDILHEAQEVMSDTENFVVPIGAGGQVITRWGDPYRKQK